MALWDKVKNAGKRTKLQGEIVLLDREIKARQQAFGVDLYDLLAGDSSSSFVNKATPGSLLFPNESQIKVPYDICRADIQILLSEKYGHEEELQRVQATRERGRPAMTANEKLSKAGQWVSSTGSEAKLQAQMLLLDRQIKQRKEAFGVDVFALITAKDIDSRKTGGVVGISSGVKSKVSSRLSKLSQKEQKIEECVEKAKNDVGLLQASRDRKEREMLELQGRGTF